MKKVDLLLIGLIFIFVLLLIFLNKPYKENVVIAMQDKSIEHQYINMPNKCYSQLQPKPYFTPQIVSAISYFPEDGSIKINPINDKHLNIMKITNTGSMRPAIPDYSKVIIINATGEEINIGDTLPKFKK